MRQQRVPGRVFVYEVPNTLLWQPSFDTSSIYSADMLFLSTLVCLCSGVCYDKHSVVYEKHSGVVKSRSG